jgi:hypothetical protein
MCRDEFVGCLIGAYTMWSITVAVCCLLKVCLEQIFVESNRVRDADERSSEKERC